ncbi:MAG: acyl--CoA ligase [Planctomycetes bacterium]|nr:acyl--CoA ligase [Planctomycetota bacterium]
MKNLLSSQSIREFLDNVQEATPETLPTAGALTFENVGQRWAELGLQPGDLVLFSLPNGRALLEQFFGALHAGLVPVMLAPNLPSTRIKDLVRVLRARALAAPRLNPAALEASRSDLLGTLEVCLFRHDQPSLTKPGEVVLLTSGTSGFSSGCVFNIEQLLLNGQRHADAIGQRSTDTVLVNLPLYYSFALVAQTLGTFVRRGRLVIDGPPFQVPRYVRALAEYQVDVSALTPILSRALLRTEGAFAETSRVLSIGGDSLIPEDVAALLQRRPDRELYLTYGLTQAGPRVSTLSAHREPPERFSSVGLPLAGTTVSFRPAAGDAHLQELLVTSATVMQRKIGLVEGRSPHSDAANGTVATGDIFEQDAEGYLFFKGRLSDFIVKNGEKISLAGVRRVATQLPDVVNAKTKVIVNEAGDQDFELTLFVSSETHDYEGQLRRQLRRTELPCKTHVEHHERTLVRGHK